MNYINNYR